MKRLLLVTYYFPPSGGPGVQRMLKFVKYLPAFGWQPTVLTVRPEDAAYPNLDPTFEREVPADVRVERTRAWDPYALYARLLGKQKDETVGVGFIGEAEPSWKERAARWVRANVFLPDARVGWVPFAAVRGRALLTEAEAEGAPFDALLTTGPPHSTHLAGLLLARWSGLPWIADFRDPWTDIDYIDLLPMSPPARALDAALERTVLRAASLVTTVSPAWARDLRARADGAYAVVRNGFDPADFAGLPPRPPDDFVLTYVGNMNAVRDPEAVWDALAALRAEGAVPRLRVRLVGNIDPAVEARVRAAGLADVVEVEPYVPHAEAVRAMQASTLLLLVVDPAANQAGRVPGKVYEYLAAGRPVLSLGPPDGDAAAILAETGGGATFAPDDRAGVRAALRAHYDAWASGTPRAGAAPEALAPHSRRAQAQALAAHLDRLAAPSD